VTIKCRFVAADGSLLFVLVRLFAFFALICFCSLLFSLVFSQLLLLALDLSCLLLFAFTFALVCSLVCNNGCECLCEKIVIKREQEHVSVGACGSMDSAWTGAPAARIVYFRSPVARDLCPSI
jgi:ABC-type transport system involved in multi-copper enzyme maturation permease subunit